jgi:hypothetical protein
MTDQDFAILMWTAELLVNINLEDKEGNEKTALEWILGKYVESEGRSWLRIMLNDKLWYKW